MAREYKKDLVSIGFPVYNGATRMRSALESLLNQTYKNTEIIISDNASTDDTEKMCREYAARDSRIRYVRQHVNLTQIPNVEFVMRAARGEYFVLGADDDWWHPEFIEKLKAILDSHSEYGVAMCAVRNVSIDGNFLGETTNVGPNDLTHRTCGEIFNKMSHRGLIHYIYGLYRTRLLDSLSRQPFPACIRPDRVFLCEVALATKIYSLRDVLYHKTTYTVPVEVRYSTEPIGIALRSSAPYTAYVLAVVKRIVCSRSISLGRKFTLYPFYIPKFLWTWRRAILKEWL